MVCLCVLKRLMKKNSIYSVFSLYCLPGSLGRTRRSNMEITSLLLLTLSNRNIYIENKPYHPSPKGALVQTFSSIARSNFILWPRAIVRSLIVIDYSRLALDPIPFHLGWGQGEDCNLTNDHDKADEWKEEGYFSDVTNSTNSMLVLWLKKSCEIAVFHQPYFYLPLRSMTADEFLL